MLFSIYINDLVLSLSNTSNTDEIMLGNTKLNCLLYADDIVLLSTSQQGLENCINTVKDFSKAWRMEVNLNKTKVMIFNKKVQTLTYNFKHGKGTLECTNTYPYLGISLTSSDPSRNHKMPFITNHLRQCIN